MIAPPVAWRRHSFRPGAARHLVAQKSIVMCPDCHLGEQLAMRGALVDFADFERSL